MSPRFIDLERTALLPPSIRWDATEWRWSVVVAPEEPRQRVIAAYHGTFGDFDEVTSALGTPGPANYLKAIGRQLADALEQQ